MRRFSSARFYFGGATTIGTKDLIINDDIKVKEVRMLDENGDQMGVMPLEKAKEYAYEKDLIWFSSRRQGNPPVCRSMDYGKYRYERDQARQGSEEKAAVC